MEDTAEAHEKNWRDLVRGDDWREFPEKKRPFDVYQVDYAVGQDFFLERVAKSHITSLLEYALCLLHNLQDRGDLEHEEVEDIAKRQGHDALHAIKALHSSRPALRWHDEMGTLLSYLARYERIIDRFSALKRQTKAKLKAKPGREASPQARG